MRSRAAVRGRYAFAAGILAVMVSAHAVPAQGAKAVARSATAKASGARASCGNVSATAEWVKKQRGFADSAGATFSDPALRQRLLAAAGVDPAAAFAPEPGFRIVGASSPAMMADTALRAVLRGMAEKRQWPTRVSVGAAGVHAAWVLSQGDSVLSAAAVRRMMEAGLGESSPAEVAVMEDANRVRIGRGQLYGTHFVRGADGALTLYRLEDSAHVDLRRDGAWLPTLKVSACLARQAAQGSK